MSVDILGTSCDQCRTQFNNSLRPRKPEGSLGRIAQDVHLDSHTAPELEKRKESRNTGFNTLDNWGHKTPTQSKGKRRTGKKRLKVHGLEHVYNTFGYISLSLSELY